MAIRPLVISERITRRESDSFNKYLNEIDKIERLTTDEEYEVAMKAFKGDESAREELITKNLRFVISVAKQYITKGVTLEDLVNEGNLGLVRAAERFDPTQGFKFISYAVWWIRRCIMEFLTNCSRVIRIPSNKTAILPKMNEFVDTLEQKLERGVTKDDIIENIDGAFTEKEIEFFLSLEETAVSSVDKKLSDDSDSTLVDTIEGHTFPLADHLVKSEDNEFFVKTLLELLPKDNHREVIIHLFGLEDGDPLSLKETAEVMDISRERVRQIRDQAIRILKAKTIKKDINFMR